MENLLGLFSPTSCDAAVLPSGDKVIIEGENGDYLFVIESGSLDCIKSVDGQACCCLELSSDARPVEPNQKSCRNISRLKPVVSGAVETFNRLNKFDPAGARRTAHEPSIYSFGHFFQWFVVECFRGCVFVEPPMWLAPIVVHKHNNPYNKQINKKTKQQDETQRSTLNK